MLRDENYVKILGLLEKYGFKYPVYLWKTDEGELFNLDGNQRVLVIRAEYGDVEIPYLPVSAKNREEAKEQILALSSNYGEITQEGFEEFIQDIKDLEKSLEFVTFDDWAEAIQEDFEQLEFKPNVQPTFQHKDVTQQEVEKKSEAMDNAMQQFTDHKIVECICPECGYEFNIKMEKR